MVAIEMVEAETQFSRLIDDLVNGRMDAVRHEHSSGYAYSAVSESVCVPILRRS